MVVGGKIWVLINEEVGDTRQLLSDLRIVGGRRDALKPVLWVDDALPLTSPHSTHADVPDLNTALSELLGVSYLVGGVAFKYTRTPPTLHRGEPD